MKKPILCLDFDGVIHSYTSGWKGAAIIPDQPVPGALEFIVKALDSFEVHIFSSRSHQWGGKRAMKRWLYRHLCECAATYETTPDWLLPQIRAFSDPWPDQVNWDIKRIINHIRWPWFKPAAMVTIDDRALTFSGIWPAFDELHSFKPWNKKHADCAPQSKLESLHWPIGTNLLTATQAEEMFINCVGEEIDQLRTDNERLKAELAEAKKTASLVDACHAFINSPVTVESCMKFNAAVEAMKGK